MTGFAKRQGTIDGKTVTIEIKTLNSKTLDLNVKLAAAYRSHEMELRRRMARLQRGKVDVFINEENSVGATLQLNRDLLCKQYEELKAVSEELHCDSSRLLEQLAAQSDIWIPSERVEANDEMNSQLDSLLEQTLDDVEQTRQHEGEILEQDIRLHLDAIEERLQRIGNYEAERIDTARERIKKYFEEFALKEIDSNRFEQEIIYYLEKLDITEEKVRLKKHLDYFRQTMQEEEACGKKLGFIAQEMGREINTTGSKANHAEMQKAVVEMKDELEKIKEQLGNIL